MDIQDYESIPSAFLTYDSWSYIAYDIRNDPYRDNCLINSIGFIAIPICIYLTPFIIVVDIIIGIFESVYVFIVYDFKNAKKILFAKCVASPIQQLVISAMKTVGFITRPLQWNNVYRDSMILALRLPDSINYKCINIFFENGHRDIFKEADLPYPDGPDPFDSAYDFHFGAGAGAYDPFDDPFDDFFGAGEFDVDGSNLVNNFRAKKADVAKISDVTFPQATDKYLKFRALSRANPTARQVLDISDVEFEELTESQLKKKYRNMMRYLHPDKAGPLAPPERSQKKAVEQESQRLLGLIFSAHDLLKEQLGFDYKS